MHSFTGFIIKEFKQIYRDKRTLVVLFGMPVIMMILFGYAIRNEVEDARLAVLDHSKDEVTRRIIQKIDASRYFTVVGSVPDNESIEREFEEDRIDEVIVFEHDFQRKLQRAEQPEVKVITDASNPNLAQLVQEYTSAIVKDYEQLAVGTNRAVPVQPSFYMMFNPQLESSNLFVPGLIAVILMLICALMTSISITREKEMGNMEILLVSPLKPYHIILGKVLPYIVLSFSIVVAILALARWVFEVPFRGSYLFFMVEAAVFIFTALALGVFISTRANNQQTAMMFSLAGLLLPTVLLSGFIFPISSMPLPLQWLSNIIPARWFLVIVRSIMLKGSGIMLVWKETLVLVGMTVIFIGLSIKSFKIRLE